MERRLNGIFNEIKKKKKNHGGTGREGNISHEKYESMQLKMLLRKIQIKATLKKLIQLKRNDVNKNNFNIFIKGKRIIIKVG